MCRMHRPAIYTSLLQRGILCSVPGSPRMSGRVYVVLVTGKVKPGRMAEFKEYFKPLADHVTANEAPNCLTYQLSIGEDDPDSLCIYERYTDKEFLEQVHWQSEPFKTFGAKVRAADLWESKQVIKYWEEVPGAFGFVSR